MSKQKPPEEINDAQKRFCQEYIYDFNGTRAYQKAYPNASYETAMVNSSVLLRNTKIEAYCKELQKDIAKQIGVSAIMLGNELKKLATSNIALLHKDWLTREEFNELSDDVKASIQEIDTKILKRNIGTAKEPDIVDVEYIKIKLHSKIQAIELLNKMLGYNAPEKHELIGNSTKIEVQDEETKTLLEEVKKALNDIDENNEGIQGES